MITPFALTVATLLLEDTYVTFSVEFFGVTTGFKVSFLPFARVTLDFIPVIFVVFTTFFLTVTVIFAVFPLASFTVTIVLPAFTPLITPLLVTVAIFLFSDVQDFTESPFARPVTFTLPVDCFSFRERLVTLSLIVAVSFLP